MDKFGIETEKLFLNQLRKNPELTNMMLCNLTNFSDSYVRKVIASLKAKGLLSRVGGRKIGYWKVIDHK